MYAYNYDDDDIRPNNINNNKNNNNMLYRAPLAHMHTQRCDGQVMPSGYAKWLECRRKIPRNNYGPGITAHWYDGMTVSQ